MLPCSARGHSRQRPLTETGQDTDLKKTDLYKNDRLKVVAQMKAAAGQRAVPGAPVPIDRKEQRRIDQARGLVPFAVKLDAELAARLRDLATERGVALNDLVDELLRKALD
jgi:hypothetical protein